MVTKMLVMAMLIKVGCNGKSKVENSPAEIKKYIFFGHTYSLLQKQKVDQRIELVDKSTYDLILLGGDITLGSSATDTVLEYIDSVFHISENNTHWAVGNHDCAYPEKLMAKTKKPLFYSFVQNKAVFLILDSQTDGCEWKGEQLSMIETVIGTINNASHLILVSHKLCWLYGNEKMQQFEWVANSGFGKDYYHTNPNKFHGAIYPKLAALEAKGIEVTCIAGDIGMNSKTFEYHSPEGIDFLASGISPKQSPLDKVLVIEHDVANQKINWKFLLLDEMV